MTQMHINGSETGVVRVFHIDLPPQAIERFTTQAGTGEYPVKYGLGATHLRPAFVDVVDLRDLGDMSLSDYLKSAYQVTPAELQGVRQRLDGLRGHVIVLPSQAFDHVSQDLSIASPLRWICTLAEDPARPRGAPLRSRSAKSTPGAPSAERAAPRSRRTMYVTLIAIALLVVLVAGTLAKIS